MFTMCLDFMCCGLMHACLLTMHTLMHWKRLIILGWNDLKKLVETYFNDGNANVLGTV